MLMSSLVLSLKQSSSGGTYLSNMASSQIMGPGVPSTSSVTEMLVFYPCESQAVDPSVTPKGQSECQSWEVTSGKPRPGRKDFSPPLKKQLVPLVPQPPTGQMVPNKASRKALKANSVHLKKPRKVLFELRAAEGEQDHEATLVPQMKNGAQAL